MINDENIKTAYKSQHGKCKILYKQSINNHLDLDNLKGSSILDEGHMNLYKDKVQQFFKKDLPSVCDNKCHKYQNQKNSHKN